MGLAEARGINKKIKGERKMEYRCETAKMLPTIIESLKKGDKLIITTKVLYELETDRILPFYQDMKDKKVKVYFLYKSDRISFKTEVTDGEITEIFENKRTLDAAEEARKQLRMQAVYARASKIKRIK